MTSLILLLLLFMLFGGLWLIGAGMVGRIKGTVQREDPVEDPLLFGAVMFGVSAIATWAIVSLTQEDTLLVNQDGGIQPIEGKVRFVLQRKAFLARQESFVDAEIERVQRGKTGAQMVAELRQQVQREMEAIELTLDKAERERDQPLRDHYLSDPTDIPIAPEIIAGQLRRLASEIEREAQYKRLAERYDHMRAEDMAFLNRTKQAIRSMR